MEIAIIDDNKEDAKLLAGMCSDWSAASQTDIHYDRYLNGEEFLQSFVPGKYQLIFMDIYMADLSGIDTARIVREQDVECLLVFLTTSREHTWDSFPLHPFDYILKPCTYEQISRVLSEAGRVLPDISRTLEMTYGRQKILFSYQELMSLEADGHYVRITSVGRGALRCYTSSFMSLWDTLCQDKRFLLCNRGIIINMDYVEKYTAQDFVLKNGQAFPIRQNNRNSVIDAFLTYQYEQAKQYGKRYLS